MSSRDRPLPRPPTRDLQRKKGSALTTGRLGAGSPRWGRSAGLGRCRGRGVADELAVQLARRPQRSFPPQGEVPNVLDLCTRRAADDGIAHVGLGIESSEPLTSDDVRRVVSLARTDEGVVGGGNLTSPASANAVLATVLSRPSRRFTISSAPSLRDQKSWAGASGLRRPAWCFATRLCPPSSGSRPESSAAG
jgi:hypothetical protein